MNTKPEHTAPETPPAEPPRLPLEELVICLEDALFLLGMDPPERPGLDTWLREHRTGRSECPPPGMLTGEEAGAFASARRLQGGWDPDRVAVSRSRAACVERLDQARAWGTTISKASLEMAANEADAKVARVVPVVFNHHELPRPWRNAASRVNKVCELAGVTADTIDPGSPEGQRVRALLCI